MDVLIHVFSWTLRVGRTVHPRFGEYRDRSPLWAATRWNHTTQEMRIETWRQRLDNVRVRLRVPRFVYSHEYRGARRGDERARAYLRDRLELEEDAEGFAAA